MGTGARMTRRHMISLLVASHVTGDAVLLAFVVCRNLRIAWEVLHTAIAAQLALVGIWLVFGRTRWAVRLLVSGLGVASLVWLSAATVLGTWDPWNVVRLRNETLVAAVLVGVVIVIASVLGCFGYALRPTARDEHRSCQFTVRQLTFLTLIVS